MADITGFIAFIRDIMQIDTAKLPDNAPIIPVAFQAAVETVNEQILSATPFYYDLAVYNFGGDFLINWAPDQPGQTYFKGLRAGYNISSFVAGVISESHDENTGQSLEVPDFFKNLTLADLQQLKTPYGRAYLAIAQKVGTLWGLS